MKRLDKYLNLEKEIFEYFGYVEDWVVIPIDDQRESYWWLSGEKHGDFVGYAEQEIELDLGGDAYYENQIYTQRFLPKWVYRGKDYTMVVVDTQTDSNKFLQIFDNSRERKLPSSNPRS